MSKSSFPGLTGGNGGRVDFDEIKRSADIVAVIQGRGVELKREGQDWIGLCPFHNDRTPSLRVTPGKGLWRCMSPACGATGNAIQFVARKDNVSDKEAALRLLATLPGVQTARQLEKKTSSPAVTVPLNVAAELLGRVTGFYRRALFKADRAGLDYLARRNLADPAMLEAFQVGYCNGTLKAVLPESGEVIAQLQALGVLNARGNEVFYGRVVVPILDAAGVVVGLYGRKVEGEGARLPAEAARHLYLAGGHKAAFNAAAAKHAGRVIFTEAIFDALSLWQAGERAAVPLYGAEGWTEHHEELVRTTEAKELVLALDNDATGHAATARLLAHLAPLADRTPPVPVRVLTWPEGVKDANVFFSSRENAVAEFATLIAAAEPKPVMESQAAGKENEAGGAAAGEPKTQNYELKTTEHGFAVIWPQRRYDVMAIERVGATRLKATVKALGAEPGRFHVETIDLYSAKARRLFAAEVARLFRLPVEVTESDLARLLVEAERRDANGGAPGTGAGATPLPPSAQDRLEAVKLGRSADLVGEIARDLAKLGVVGEERNGLALYLVMTSRKMADPLAAHILASSGAGKSHLQDRVLSLCPEEDLIKLTSLSNQALFYKGEDALRHKCLAVEEVAGAQGARYAVRNLISAQKLTVETTIKNPLTGKMETQTNTVHGPTAVFETTTQPDTDPETKSRYLVLSVDESAGQTRAIVAAQRHSHTLAALVAKQEREAVMRRHRAFQRLLRPLAVVNPYEPLLIYGDERLTTRRDQPKYLNLILAVAFLHQMQRPVKNHPVLGDYIEATLDDIAIANDLALELFGASLDELSAPGRCLAELIAERVEAWAAARQCEWSKVEWSRRELREALKWSEARLRLHLDELVRLEYVQPLCGSHGSAFRYRLLVAPETIRAGSRTLPGIRSVEEVRRAANLAGLGGNFASEKTNFAGQNGHFARVSGHFASTSQGRVAKLEPAVTSSPAVRKPAVVPNFATVGGGHMRAVNGSAL